MDYFKFPIAIQSIWILVVLSVVAVWAVPGFVDHRYFSVLEEPRSHRTVTCTFTASGHAAFYPTAMCQGACKEKGYRVVDSNISDVIIDWFDQPPPWHRAEVIAKYVPLACRL